MFEDDLTAREREALDGLPREARPSDLLEERTVRLLESRGLLTRRTGGLSATSSRRVVAAAAVAAALALGSFWLGRWSNQPVPEVVPTSGQGQNLRRAAREVQRTGSEYILALDAFAGAKPGDTRDLDQGREVARVTLRAAADRVFDLAPRKAKDEQLIWF